MIPEMTSLMHVRVEVFTIHHKMKQARQTSKVTKGATTPLLQWVGM